MAENKDELLKMFKSEYGLNDEEAANAVSAMVHPGLSATAKWKTDGAMQGNDKGSPFKTPTKTYTDQPHHRVPTDTVRAAQTVFDPTGASAFSSGLSAGMHNARMDSIRNKGIVKNERPYGDLPAPPIGSSPSHAWDFNPVTSLASMPSVKGRAPEDPVKKRDDMLARRKDKLDEDRLIQMRNDLLAATAKARR
jgi:hypothetical protein